MHIGSHVHIVCSDQARNGKTLYARILADRFALADERKLRVFDTDYPNGDLARWFPQQSQIIDLSQTGDQVKLFDTMIGEPTNNYVVDLQSERLLRFFTIFYDIAFDEGAREAGIGISVHFVLDRSTSSLQAARMIRSKLRCSEYVVVINEAIGTIFHLASARESYDRMAKNREIVLPRISGAARAYIDQPDFSFSRFIAGRADEVPSAVRYELWSVLETMYNQRSPA